MKSKKEKVPADLGLKIAASPEEAKWHEIKERASATILTAKLEIEINETIVKLAEKKIIQIATKPDYVA